MSHENDPSLASVTPDIREEQASGMDHTALMRIYLGQIGGRQLLTTEQIEELDTAISIGRYARQQLGELPSGQIDDIHRDQLQRMVQTGHEAQNSLAAANLRLVVSIAKSFRGQHLEMLDLIQEGSIGLMRAVELYDSGQGMFSNYATWWIRQAIVHGIANTGRTLRVPLLWHEARIMATGAQWRLAQELGREPTTQEISERTGLSELMLRKIASMPEVVTSLDSPLDDDVEGADLFDVLPDPQALLPEEYVVGLLDMDEKFRELSKQFAELSKLERQILLLRFGVVDGEYHSLSEVGHMFGLTALEVRRIEAPAYRQLKKLVLQSQVAVVN